MAQPTSIGPQASPDEAPRSGDLAATQALGARVTALAAKLRG